MQLSILICTLPNRKHLFDALWKNLTDQLARLTGVTVEVLAHDAGKEFSTGQKRNALLALARGQYIVFIDDDDEVSDYYIAEMLRGCASGCDCLAINGHMTTNGAHRIAWRLSKDYQNIDSTDASGAKIYLRKTNHITAVRRTLALQAGFPDKSNAEDKWYSDRVAPLCKTEFVIDRPMYHYRYSTVNKEYK